MNNEGFEPFNPLDSNSKKDNCDAFPLEGFPSWARDFIIEVAESFHVSPGMVGSAVLGCLATAVQAKFDVQPKTDHTEQLSLQFIIIAPSGSLKTPIFKLVFEPAYQFEEELIRNFREYEDEQLQSATPLPTVIVDDSTPEALAIRLQQNNGRIGIVSAEGNIFSVLAGRYSKSPDYNILAKGYSGDPVRYDRVLRDTTTIPHPHVSCCIGMQPHVFSSLVENTALDSQGILARWCMADFHNPRSPREYNSPSVKKETTRNYNEHMRALFLLAVPHEPRHLTLSPDAFAHFCEVFKGIEMTRIEKEQVEENGTIVRWINKKAGCILRLAGLLHVSTDQLTTEITTAELTAAAGLADWYYENAVRLLSSQNRVISNAMNLWTQMRSNRSDDNRISYSQLTHDCCRNRRFLIPGTSKLNNKAINAALNVLVEHGYIRIAVNQTNGRPLKTIILSEHALAASDPETVQNC